MVSQRHDQERNWVLARWARLQDAVTSRLWPIPTAAIALAVVIGILLPELDARVDEDLPDWVRSYLFNGATDSARAVLSAISGSLITASSLTFSLTVIALQLASTQASPRLLRMFARDSVVQATLGLFLGTFAYSVTVLRAIQDETENSGATVPRLAITLASLLTLASVIMLTLFLAHLARELRIETMLRNVHEETDLTIRLESSVPDNSTTIMGAAPRPPRTASAPVEASGFITKVNRRQLLRIATEHEIVIAEEHRVGDSVIAGVPLVTWWTDDPGTVVTTDDRDRIAAAVNEAYETDFERNANQDIGFGLRQLVDIANRALSPSLNDPTSAVHALSHISSILCQVTQMPDPAVGLIDEAGTLRVVLRPPDFTDLLELAIEQPRRYGAKDPDFAARLFQLLREVGYSARTSSQRDAVRQQSERLSASIREAGYDAVELQRFERLALTVDDALDGRWSH